MIKNLSLQDMKQQVLEAAKKFTDECSNILSNMNVGINQLKKKSLKKKEIDSMKNDDVIIKNLNKKMKNL